MEDMLRACVLDFKGSWEKYLSLVEFAYNNSYHSTIEMAPYEVCMVENASPHCVGKRLVRENCWDQKSFR